MVSPSVESAAGIRTGDLGGSATTAEFTDAVLQRCGAAAMTADASAST